MRYPVNFLYCPRSGSKIICPATEADDSLCLQRLPVVRWPNGSAHVPGERVEVDARMPGAWWRDRARDVARALANGLGGIAYDENGFVGLIVMPGSARFALAALLAAAPVSIFDEQALAALCSMPLSSLRAWRTVAPYLRADEWVEHFGRALRDNLVTPVGVPTWRYTVDVVAGRVIVALDASDGSWAHVTAPGAWGLPTVFGAERREPETNIVPDGFEHELADVDEASA